MNAYLRKYPLILIIIYCINFCQCELKKNLHFVALLNIYFEHFNSESNHKDCNTSLLIEKNAFYPVDN